MKRTALLASLAIAFAILAVPAMAADSAGQFAVRGVGRANCEQFLKALNEKSDVRLVFAGWIDGYLTGVNQYSPNTFDVAPWESTEVIGRLLKKNCERNPSQGFFALLNSVALVFKEERLSESSPRIAARNGDKAVAVYKATLEKVQQKLKERGHYSGAVDGAFGPATKTAIEAFQQAEGLKVTGLPDQLTLWRLLRPSSKAN